MPNGLTINLNGEQVKHNGEIAGRHGITNDGTKVYVNFAPPFWNANAFVMSEAVFDKIHDDVDLICFRDKAHDLHVFRAASWFDPDDSAERIRLEPNEMGSEDAVQIGVKMWDSIQLHETQGEGFNLDGGKHTAVTNVA